MSKSPEPMNVFEVGQWMGRDEAQTEVIFRESYFWTNFTNNLKWYFVGRYSGLVAYFFPAVFALALFLAGARRRPLWQWLVVGSAVAQILLFVITLPYTWFGGGGSVGNRYFMGFYGVFFFLLPPVTSMALAIVPWVVGGIFVAKLVLNPFTTSFYPGTYAESGPLRILPVELSNTNDLPINTEMSSRVIWFGDAPGQHQAGVRRRVAGTAGLPRRRAVGRTGRGRSGSFGIRMGDPVGETCARNDTTTSSDPGFRRRPD